MQTKAIVYDGARPSGLATMLIAALVNAHRTRALLDMVAVGHLDTAQFVTERFTLGQMLDAWHTVTHAEKTGAIKVMVTR